MRISTMLSAGLLAAGLAAGAANAQPRMFGPGGGDGYMMGPGMMMMGRGGDMCGPRAAGLAEWRIDRIGRAVKPTDAQKAKLDALRDASKKAANSLAKACPASWPATASERLGLMETRMQVMLDAIKAVRPAFDDFYGSLDAGQKSRLDGAGPRGWGWNWWRNR